MARPFRSFAVIPAAGASVRMGRPKLLLPWGGRSIIEHVLEAWKSSGVDHVVMVANQELGALEELGQELGVEVVVPPVAPAQMKDSVLLGLRHILQRHVPKPTDAWLLAPADMPRLSSCVIDRLLAAYDPLRAETLVPVFGGRRRHPILLPLGRVREVEALPPECGINSMMSPGKTVEIEVPDAGIGEDLDTPEDYQRLGQTAAQP